MLCLFSRVFVGFWRETSWSVKNMWSFPPIRAVGNDQEDDGSEPQALHHGWA